MQAIVDTTHGTINVHNEAGEPVASYSYELERKRTWNVGRRRHINELTGKVIVYTTRWEAYAKCRDFQEAKAKVIDWYARRV